MARYNSLSILFPSTLCLYGIQKKKEWNCLIGVDLAKANGLYFKATKDFIRKNPRKVKYISCRHQL